MYESSIIWEYSISHGTILLYYCLAWGHCFALFYLRWFVTSLKGFSPSCSQRKKVPLEPSLLLAFTKASCNTSKCKDPGLKESLVGSTRVGENNIVSYHIIICYIMTHSMISCYIISSFLWHYYIILVIIVSGTIIITYDHTIYCVTIMVCYIISFYILSFHITSFFIISYHCMLHYIVS